MKGSSFTMGLALALAVSAAGVAGAQTTQRPERVRGAQSDSGFRQGPGGRGMRGGGPEGMLLRGITLSDNQKTRLEQLRASERQEFGAQRAQGARGVRGGRPDVAQGQRQPRDTTGMGKRRAEMEQRREQRIASIRSILDANQRAQFDRNVADMKAHGQRQGGRGGRRGEDGARS